MLAFVGGAALGLLIATLIARRLARIARAAKAIGAGDFSAQTLSRFPDEVGSLALLDRRMRGQLHELFDRLAHERDRLERLLDRLSEGVLLIDRDLNVEFANGHARELLGVGDRLDDLALVATDGRARLRRFADDLFSDPARRARSGSPRTGGRCSSPASRRRRAARTRSS